MRRLFVTATVAITTSHARADNYGIDEAMSEGGGSWGAVFLVILLLLYLHFKEK